MNLKLNVMKNVSERENFVSTNASNPATSKKDALMNLVLLRSKFTANANGDLKWAFV